MMINQIARTSNPFVVFSGAGCDIIPKIAAKRLPHLRRDDPCEFDEFSSSIERLLSFVPSRLATATPGDGGFLNVNKGFLPGDRLEKPRTLLSEPGPTRWIAERFALDRGSKPMGEGRQSPIFRLHNASSQFRA